MEDGNADGWPPARYQCNICTYVAVVCSISCISWRGVACICSCFVRANYYTPLWRAARVERGVEWSGGLRIRRSKGISSKYLRASINILHKRIPPSSPSIGQLFRESYSRKLVSSKDRPTIGNESTCSVLREVEVSKLENCVFVPSIGLD